MSLRKGALHKAPLQTGTMGRSALAKSYQQHA